MKRFFSPWPWPQFCPLSCFRASNAARPNSTGAKLQIQQKNYPEAVRLLEAEVAKNPSNAEAWYLLGYIQSEQNNVEGMNRAFSEAQKLSQEHASDIKNIRMYQWVST